MDPRKGFIVSSVRSKTAVAYTSVETQRAVPNHSSKIATPPVPRRNAQSLYDLGIPGRAAVASIVSSSRFLVRKSAVWGRNVSAGTVLSSIDWDAGRGIVAVGAQDGSIGTSLTPGQWCDDVSDEHGGIGATRNVDWWRTSTSGLNSQV